MTPVTHKEKLKAWLLSVKPGTEFTRQRVVTLCGTTRQRAANLIRWATAGGLAKRVKHGWYETLG